MPNDARFLVLMLCVGLAICLKVQATIAQSDSQPIEVSGTVLDEDNQPVAGARIFAFAAREKARKVFEGVSDSAGKYRVPLDTDATDVVTLVYKPGLAVSVLKNDPYQKHWYPVDFRAATSPAPDPANGPHVLLPAESITVQVNDEAGQPVAVSSARLGFLSILGSDCKPEIARNLPIKIVGNKITVDFLAKETHFSVILNESSDRHDASRGETEIWMTVGDPSKESATIRKTASLTGRVVNEKNEPVSGITVKASSRPSTPMISECTVTFDIEQQSGSDGKFEFPDIASGSVNLWILSEKVALPDRLAALTLNAGDNAEQTLVVKPACQISGRVVDTAGKPISGVKLSIGKVVVTDAEGKYSGYANSSHVFANILEMPPGYLEPFDSQVGAQIEPSITNYALEDLVLERVQPLTGTVVDEQGKAVPNSVIKTIWQKRKNSMSSAAFDMAFADENGWFQLNATTQRYDFGITARSENLATPETRIITPQDKRKPLELVVSTEGVFELQGTVIADDGNGIPNASILLKQALLIPDGNVYGEFPVFKDVLCITDRDGKFEFPIRLSRTARYSIGVQAKGYMAEETPMLSVERDQGLLQPSPIKLTQTRFASGVVVDTTGKPVAGATLQSFAAVKRDAPGESRIVVKSDEEGRFVLNNVHPSCNLCFVNKPGYRFQGAPITFSDPEAIDAPEFKIVIESVESPSGRSPLKLISPDARKRQQATRALIEQQYRLVGTQPGRYWLSESFDFALKSDHAMATKIARETSLGDVKAVMLFKLGEIDEAVELAAALSEPTSRARTFLAGSEAVDSKEQKKQLLLEASFHAKTIQNVERRVETYASIIEGLNDNGNEETGRSLAKLALPLAESLGNDGRGPFARGRLARATVELFPDRSVALIESIDDKSSLNRHLGNLAHEMAAINPDLAEKLLEKIQGSDTDHHIPPVIYRMGPTDLPRAIGLTEKITGQYSSTAYKANALGVLAYSIRESDPEKSKELLSQAFTTLWNHRDHRYSLGVAINLLRFASEIAPDNSETYFWTTLALYADPNHRSWGADQLKSETQIHMAKQAVLLALFDRLPQVRAAILEPIMADLSEFSDKNDRWFRDSSDRGIIYAALALTLPDETVEWHAKYYANIPKDAKQYLPQPWEVIAHCWTKTEVELADYIVSELEHDWVIDKEDF